ncbi:MAG: hypothetical protein R2788_23500 [Saprospiraceae bacterium]|jgi:hypothetical protein
MASNKKLRENDLDEKKLLLASKYVADLVSILEKLLTSKNTDNQ